MKTRKQEILAEARRLRERGPMAQYPEDEARFLAEATLELLIELLEVLTGGQGAALEEK